MSKIDELIPSARDARNHYVTFYLRFPAIVYRKIDEAKSGVVRSTLWIIKNNKE